MRKENSRHINCLEENGSMKKSVETRTYSLADWCMKLFSC